jgi:hypothetical protein
MDLGHEPSSCRHRLACRSQGNAGAGLDVPQFAAACGRRSIAPVEQAPQPVLLDAVSDLLGSVDGLPRDMSARTKKYLKSTGYGDKRAR